MLKEVAQKLGKAFDYDPDFINILAKNDEKNEVYGISFIINPQKGKVVVVSPNDTYNG